MDGIKISELPAIETPVAADFLPIVDVDASTTKKMTLQQLIDLAASGMTSLSVGTITSTGGVSVTGDMSQVLVTTDGGQIRVSAYGLGKSDNVIEMTNEVDSSLGFSMTGHGSFKAQRYSLRPKTLAIVDGEISPDAALHLNFEVTLNANAVLNSPGGSIFVTDMDKVMIRITQDGTGGRTLTLGEGWAFGDEVNEFTVNPAPNAVTYLVAVYRAIAGTWDVVGGLGGYGA